ncbi:peptidase C14 [Viridothelium virens]|uniref:Peptidase C14 n=1 Tax=Viridothelium virens TaxID=1048519 RepID=A0A6A6GS99_VIRVR|nr:peptidase C14 [Viridothelium virens]
MRRKSLLIGINYTDSRHALRGCHQDVANVQEFISYRGFSQDHRSQVVMRDDTYTDPNGPFYPNGHNILAAMHWLVSEPYTRAFLHYSGHGGQVPDTSGDSSTGLNDTIVPVDFEYRGQLDSDILHQHLVHALHPTSTLFIVFDCCHSGSACELPFVYRSDADGNVSAMDNLRQGVRLVGEAEHLIQGGFSFNKLGEAESLFAGATDFFKGLKHMGEQREEGLQADDSRHTQEKENKYVTMYSGCRDDQTSADASIAGANVGAMSWAFLETMKRAQNPSYLQTLQMTRGFLDQSHYQQIPQLSTGVEMDLDQPLFI